MTRIAVLGNQNRVTGGMIVWVGGELAYGYGRELDEIPPTDWDVMSTDGLTYRMLESGQAWAVQLADGEAKAHLEWHGLSPATSYDAHPNGPLPKAVAWGHYEQSCRVTGDLVVGGHTIAFDGFGQRDHSWGFRHWAGPAPVALGHRLPHRRALLQPVRGAHPRRRHHRERLRPRPRRRRLRHRRRPRARSGPTTAAPPPTG